MRRWILGIPGLVTLGAGVWKALTSEGGTAGGVPVIAGVLLLVAPFVVDRLERVSVSGSGLELGLSRDVAEQGAPKAGPRQSRDGVRLEWIKVEAPRLAAARRA